MATITSEIPTLPPEEAESLSVRAISAVLENDVPPVTPRSWGNIMYVKYETPSVTQPCSPLTGGGEVVLVPAVPWLGNNALLAVP